MFPALCSFGVDMSTCLDVCPGVCGRSVLWGNENHAWASFLSHPGSLPCAFQPVARYCAELCKTGLGMREGIKKI